MQDKHDGKAKHFKSGSKNSPTVFLTPDDIEYSSKGIDSYFHPGTQQSDLSIKSAKRSAFFEKHNSVLALLKREQTNPLVEAGEYLNQQNRARIGEYYLTYEALTVFIEAGIRNNKATRSGSAYNTNNIFIIKNDENNFKAVLNKLNLKINEDAKFIYIHRLHSIPFYIRNIEGKIHCFFVDSQLGAPSHLIRIVKNTLPNPRIFYSSVIVQKDFYSCSTFALKTLLYFVKHGDEIFPYIFKVTSKKKNQANADLVSLDESNLMPILLKMNQSRLDVSDEIKKTVVSLKEGLTFDSYIKKYSIVLEGKVFNSAALIKKYKFFDKLDQYLKPKIGQQILPLSTEQDETNEKHSNSY